MARKKAPPNSHYEGLNQKEALIYDFIKDFYRASHYPPTVREICAGLKIPSTSTVHYYLKSLEEAGYISRGNQKMRAIEIIKDEAKEIVDIPFVGKIAAGIPILAVENITETYPLPLDLIGAKNDVFMLEIKGDSMIEAGIHHGDYVFIEKQDTADNGEIVAALIDDEATVKRYFKEDDRVRLQPENSSMEPIYTRDVNIMGKVIGVFRRIH